MIAFSNPPPQCVLSAAAPPTAARRVYRIAARTDARTHVSRAGHLPAWERSVAETQMLLKNSRLSSLQRKILIDEGARIQALVAPLKEPSI